MSKRTLGGREGHIMDYDGKRVKYLAIGQDEGGWDYIRIEFEDAPEIIVSLDGYVGWLTVKVAGRKGAPTVSNVLDAMEKAGKEE